MIALGLLLMTISAVILHYARPSTMQQVAAMGMVGGAILVLAGLVGAM